MFVLTFLSMAISGCKNDEVMLSDINYNGSEIVLTENELLSISFDDNVQLSEDEAVDILYEYLNNNLKTRQMRYFAKIGSIRKNDITFETNLKSRISDVKSSIFIYEMDVASNGENYTAIISGDKRFPFVLAYFAKCREEGKKLSSEILPIQYSEEVLLNNIKYVELIEDSLRTSTLKKIAKEMKIPTDNIKLDTAVP